MKYFFQWKEKPDGVPLNKTDWDVLFKAIEDLKGVVEQKIRNEVLCVMYNELHDFHVTQATVKKLEKNIEDLEQKNKFLEQKLDWIYRSIPLIRME